MKEFLRKRLNTASWMMNQLWQTSTTLTIAVIVLGLLQGVLPALLAIIAKNLIDTASASIAAGSANRDLLAWVSAGFGITLLTAVCGIVSLYINQLLFQKLNIHLASKILEQAAVLDYAFFEDSSNQDILHRAQQGMAQHFVQLVNQSLKIVGNSVQVVTLGWIVVSIEPIALAVFVPLGIPFALFRFKTISKRYAVMKARATKARWGFYYSQKVLQPLGTAEVKLLKLSSLFIQRVLKFMREFNEEDRRLQKEQFRGEMIFTTCSITLFYLTFLRVIYRGLSRAVTIGDITIFAVAALRLRSAVLELVSQISSVHEHTIYVDDLITFLKLEHRKKEKADPAIILPGTGKIVAENINFAYPGTLHPVLHNISFQISPGEVVAIVGPNGAGKTTLMKLLVGFYDPDSGRLLLDDHDSRTLTPLEQHRQFAFYVQGLSTFEATVAENIAYGDWENLKTDRVRIEQLSTIVGAREMIEELPQKYDTLIGRMFGQYDFSGGLWQKISLARALARKAPVLILDEPTSNLDVQAEQELLIQFREIMRAQTTILISHRLSTTRLADRILVLDKGRLVEEGHHDELLSINGFYANLFRTYQEAAHGRLDVSFTQ